MPGETTIKGIAGCAFLGAILTGFFPPAQDLQLLCALLGAVVGTAIIQS